MTNVTVERRFGACVVTVYIENREKEPAIRDVLKEAARALQIEVIKNDGTNSGNHSSW